jgi:hypothetical protein
MAKVINQRTLRNDSGEIMRGLEGIVDIVEVRV